MPESQAADATTKAPPAEATATATAAEETAKDAKAEAETAVPPPVAAADADASKEEPSATDAAKATANAEPKPEEPSASPTNGEAGNEAAAATTTAAAAAENPAADAATKVEEGQEASDKAAAASATPSKPAKPKAPPKDYGPIIETIADMDVLSGRGAAVNNHPGNKKFRALCFVRKAHFDLGNHAAKRKLATEIIELLQNGKIHPPSRFLKRRPANALPPVAKAAEAAPVKTEVAAAEEAATTAAVDGTDTPATAATDAAAPSTTTRPLFYAMTKEQAILKAQQVMRDYKRPDRLEAKMLQQQAQQARYLPASSTTTSGEGEDAAAAAAATTTQPIVSLPKPHRARAVPSTPLEGVVDMLDAPDFEKDELFKSNPFGVHAHDVLSGRGAYVNGHVGNARLRAMALDRKTQFDSGNYTEKRQLAGEIVSLIKSLDPPGRFLKKASAQLLEAHEKQKKEKEQPQAPVKEEEEPAAGEAKKEPETSAEATADASAEAAKEGEDAETTPTEKADAATADAPTTELTEEAASQQQPILTPLIDDVWEELSDDKAIHKACQVMRDISRPDRKYREDRKEERLKNKRNSKRRKLNDGGDAAAEASQTEETPTAAAAAAAAAADTTEAASTEVAATAAPTPMETENEDTSGSAEAKETSAAAVEDVVDKALLDSATSAPSTANANTVEV